MITSLKLRNFKSLVDAKIDFSDLTLLMGPNNSGKSSVLQALGFLKQSIPANSFQTNGQYATLGSYKDIAFRQDGRRRIEVACYIALIEDEFTQISNIFKESPFNNLVLDRIGFTWTFSVSRALEMSCLNDATGEKILCGRRHEPFEPSKDERIRGHTSNVRISDLLPHVSSGRQDVVNTFQVVISRASRALRERLGRRLFYLMTRRGVETRDQNIGTSRPYDVGPHGENTIPILAYIRDDPAFGYLGDKLNKWAKRFGFERVFSKLVKEAQYALTLTDEKFKIQSNVVDVGYGTNQLLPVILQCFYAPKGSMILIEEPEMHLHPRMQADLVDLFIDILNYGNKIAIETHSPHILARLQRRVAEGAIKPQDTIIHYFEKKESGSEVTPIGIDKSGYLTQRLPGFFEEDFKEALERLRAAMKIRGKPSVSSKT